MLVIVTTLAFFLVILTVSFLAVLISSRFIGQQAVTGEAGVAEGTVFDGLLKTDEVSSISPVAKLLERFDFVDIITARAAEADLDWTPGRVIAMMMLSGVIAMALLNELGWMPWFGMAVLSVVAMLTPYFYILRARSKRFTQFEHLFPEALDSLCRALRAGHPFSAGMELLALEATEPVASEMRRTLDEWKLGNTWNSALDGLAQRMPLVDVGVFVAAVKLHVKTGGRLGEVLGKLAESMRENNALQGEVRALAAHGRMTGLVLTFLPIAIALMMFYVNPAQMAILVQHPTGRILIGVAIACLVAAHFVIRKIVDIRL